MLGSSASMPKHKRSEQQSLDRREKRIALTIDTLIRERLGLPLDPSISCHKPISEYLAIAWVEGWAGGTKYTDPVTQVMSPITDPKNNDNQ